jgi:hypothetical protein
MLFYTDQGYDYKLLSILQFCAVILFFSSLYIALYDIVNCALANPSQSGPQFIEFFMALSEAKVLS